MDIDFLCSFTDTGTAMVQNWRTSSGGGGEFARWGVGPDGSIYSMTFTGTPDATASGTLQRLDPATGNVIATNPTPITGDYMQVHMAVDSRGVIYLSNGTAGGLNGGILYSFNPDLTLRWQMPIDGNLNQGGPVLGTDGTLVMASTGTFLRAYRTVPSCPADLDDGTGTGTSDGGVTIDDLLYYLLIFENGEIRADLDDGTGTGTPDGGVTIDDLLYFLLRFEAGC